MGLVQQREAVLETKTHSLLGYSFIFIVFINTLFTSGYFLLKAPLAYMLYKGGISIDRAYSITTTANILLAFSSLYFGVVCREYGSQKHSLYVGILLSTAAMGLLTLKNYYLDMMGISLYVLGGGLYYFNIILMVNNQFSNAQARIKGNYIYQIFINVGALVGAMFFLIGVNELHTFQYGFIAGVTTIVFFSFLYPYLDDKKEKTVEHVKFYLSLLFLLSLIFLLLNFELMVRVVVVTAFISAMIFAFYKAKKIDDQNLSLFILLVLLFSVPYWIANTVLFNEFIYFLMRDVASLHGVSPSLVVAIDPFMNVIFGVFVFAWCGNRTDHHYRNLSFSSLLMLIGFAVLSIGLFFDKQASRLSPIYPITTMALFACSEFLLQTTLNARIRDLLSKYRSSELIATSVLRSSRAFAVVIGYYLMTIAGNTRHIMGTEIHANFKLYLTMLCIYLGCYSGSRFVCKISVANLGVLTKNK